MPDRLYCDYCDTWLVRGLSQRARKEHIHGFKHREVVRKYYEKFLSDPRFSKVDASLQLQQQQQQLQQHQYQAHMFHQIQQNQQQQQQQQQSTVYQPRTTTNFHPPQPVGGVQPLMLPGFLNWQPGQPLPPLPPLPPGFGFPLLPPPPPPHAALAAASAAAGGGLLPPLPPLPGMSWPPLMMNLPQTNLPK